MVDPFPDENDFDLKYPLVKPVSINDTVYHESRYNKQNSVLCVYIPRKEIMFKLMRACLGVQSVDQLWFNITEPEA
jgi:hypothetical protein